MYVTTIPEEGQICLILDTCYPTEVYRWYSYNLLHLNLMHILINMMLLITYGILLSWTHENWRIALIHTFAIFNGAFAVGIEQRIYNPVNGLQMIGASGGIYGLLSSQFGNLILNWQELDIIQKIVYPSCLFSAIASDIIANSIMRPENISYSNHIGGFISGIFAGICILKNIKVIRWETYMRVAAALLLFIYTLIGMILFLTMNVDCSLL